VSPALLATAADAALAGGRLARQYFRRDPVIKKKGVIDLVTEADVAVEREIRARIGRRFPTHHVLGEEDGGAEAAGGHRWIVDPIDGTTNFAHGVALFCTSVALEVDGRVVAGAVYDPMADELFTAERGGGARLNGRRITVSPVATLVDALLVTGFPYAVEGRAAQVALFAAFLERAQAVRRLGSAALDLCFVGAGRFEAFWEMNLHAWDVAAGALIVEEAGGQVTGLDGGTYSPFGRQIMASNGTVHTQCLDVVAALNHGQAASTPHDPA
jgi:myo-inositol-1(or 4)-monophosphatase